MYTWAILLQNGDQNTLKSLQQENGLEVHGSCKRQSADLYIVELGHAQQVTENDTSQNTNRNHLII